LTFEMGLRRAALAEQASAVAGEHRIVVAEIVGAELPPARACCVPAQA
jgi:hypothetical protein